MGYETIISETNGPVTTVTLNRPERRNAVNRTMVRELLDEFGRLAADEGCRVVVLTGAGGAFSSGADLTPTDGSLPANAAAFHKRMQETNRMIAAVATLPKPVIASVPGVAAGGGCNLALVCDIVLASEAARFSEIFVRRGMTVDMGGLWALTRRVGLHRAKELAFTGDLVGAREAYEMGLINRVVPGDRLAEEAATLASKIAANAPVGVRLAKQALNRAANLTLEDALELEAQAQSICFGSADIQEGILAFAQKREPQFEGR